MSARSPGVWALLAAAALGCAEAGEPGQAALALRDSRFVVSYQAEPPTSAQAPGRLRVRVEPLDPWHVAPDAPARLSLEAPPGVTLEPAEQRSEHASELSADAIEFVSALRGHSTGAAQVRGQLKFGLCEGEDTRCVIVKRELELPLVAVR